MTDDLSFAPRRVELFYLRAPIDKPVKTSFAAMTARPAVFLRLEDADGAEGWGEIWCNHPPFTGPHRMRLAADIVGPQVIGRTFASPSEATEYLEGKTQTLCVQTAEPGPYAQVLAGFDTAFWDLAARRAGKPLHAVLNTGNSNPAEAVPCYASGINPDGAAETIAEARDAGFRRFKVKVGFGREEDIAAVDAARDALRPGEALMLDANQAWDVGEAREVSRQISNLMCDWLPDWLEEPILATAPLTDWRLLAESCRIPLAGGENLVGLDQFAAAIDNKVLSVIQPDVAKWGGVTGCYRVGHAAVSAGRRYCPHFLGAAVGLAASAHLLAAAGGPGLLEVDANANPLREAVTEPGFTIKDGDFHVPSGPGIGVTPDRAAMEPYLEDRIEVS